MFEIKKIESIIRKRIHVDESIVSLYDAKLLCRDYEKSIEKLKEMVEEKEKLNKLLVKSINNFFEVKENRFFILNSFRLTHNPLDGCLKFNLPRSLNKSSRQYFCYISMMDRLEKEYNVIIKNKDDYYLFDITLHLKLDDLFKESKLA